MPVPSSIRKILLAAALSVGALAGCTHVPISTISALDDLEPESIDARAIRIAVVTPATFRPDPGQPELTLTTGLRGSPATSRSFLLTERLSSAELAPLQGVTGPDSSAHVYGFEAEPAAELQTYLAGLMEMGAEGEREMAMSVGMSGCLVEPQRRLPLTVYVSFASSEPYRVLLRAFDLSGEADVPLCGAR